MEVMVAVTKEYQLIATAIIKSMVVVIAVDFEVECSSKASWCHFFACIPLCQCRLLSEG